MSKTSQINIKWMDFYSYCLKTELFLRKKLYLCADFLSE